MTLINENPTKMSASNEEVSPYALEMLGIRKSYGAVGILHGVDFRVRKGSVHALLGANGAGKSTLLKIAVGAVPPSEGEIVADGARHSFSSTSDARQAGIGMVFQERSLIPHLNVVDNIFLNGEIRRWGFVDQKAQRSEAILAFDKLGVQIPLSATAGALSIADQQMVEIAKAVRLAGSILILDEPTAALTEREVARLFAVVRQLASAGVGIIYVSHRLSEVFDLCDDVTIIRDGRTILSKPVSETSMAEVVDKIAGGKLNAEPERERQLSIATAEEALLKVSGLEVAGKLEKISFEIRPGEIVGVAGLAGSGRTTLMMALFGMIKPSAGKITLAGKLFVPSSPAQAIRDGIYLVPENRKSQGLVLSHTVEANAVLSILKRLQIGPFLNARRSRQVAQDTVEKLQVNPRDPQKIVEWLSGGNQQKVVLGKALNAQGRVLLLDEPTFGVDIHSRAEIKSRIREFAGKGNAAIWVTSDTAELCEVADRILILTNNTIGEPVTNWPTLTEADVTRLIQQTSHD